MSDLDAARAFALSLPGSTEEPHFEASSFRVRGRIYATVPPDDEHLHVFVDEGEVRAAVAEDPAAFEPLVWGQRLRGLRILRSDTDLVTAVARVAAIRDGRPTRIPADLRHLLRAPA